MEKCKCCHGEIPINHPQVGGVHMQCESNYFHEKQKAFKVRPHGHGNWLIGLEEVFEAIKEDDIGADWEVEIVEMTHSELDKLPEHGGW
jgi:hypothetical protein